MGSQYDVIGIGRIPDPERARVLKEERAAAVEEWNRRLDAWQETKKRRPRYPKQPQGGKIGKVKNLRIGVIEVKRTRQDLLADLREQKMLRYEQVGTCCWLAAHADALKCEPKGMLSREEAREILHKLTELGLPSTWGVLVLRHRGWYTLRPTKHVRQADPAVMRLWQERIARSLVYRLTRDQSPMAQEGK